MISLTDLIGKEAAELTPSSTSTFLSRGLNVATWRYTSPNHSSTHVPIIAIHGGPGFPHNYILPLKLITCMSGYSVIFYDQAGCGKSDRVEKTEKDAPHLLTLEYYIEEFFSLVEHYSLEEYYVFGSSWGTIIAQEISVLPRRSTGLRGVILDGVLSDSELYIRTQWRDRVSTLPSVMQKLLQKLEFEKDYSSPLYQVTLIYHNLNQFLHS